jgi:hypothetical protein
MEKKNYLLYYDKRGALYPDFLVGSPSSYYGRIQSAVARLCYPNRRTAPFFFAEFFELNESQKVHGVYYREELAGPGGASFQLLKLPDTSAGQIERAERQLRTERDVVRLSVLRIEKLIEFKPPPPEGVKAYTTTITVPHDDEAELLAQLDKVTASIRDRSIEDHELMDGSYTIGDGVLIELEENE